MPRPKPSFCASGSASGAQTGEGEPDGRQTGQGHKREAARPDLLQDHAGHHRTQRLPHVAGHEKDGGRARLSCIGHVGGVHRTLGVGGGEAQRRQQQRGQQPRILSALSQQNGQ